MPLLPGPFPASWAHHPHTHNSQDRLVRSRRQQENNRSCSLSDFWSPGHTPPPHSRSHSHLTSSTHGHSSRSDNRTSSLHRLVPSCIRRWSSCRSNPRSWPLPLHNWLTHNRTNSRCCSFGLRHSWPGCTGKSSHGSASPGGSQLLSSRIDSYWSPMCQPHIARLCNRSCNLQCPSLLELWDVDATSRYNNNNPISTEKQQHMFVVLRANLRRMRCGHNRMNNLHPWDLCCTWPSSNCKNSPARSSILFHIAHPCNRRSNRFCWSLPDCNPPWSSRSCNLLHSACQGRRWRFHSHIDKLWHLGTQDTLSRCNRKPLHSLLLQLQSRLGRNNQPNYFTYHCPGIFLSSTRWSSCRGIGRDQSGPGRGLEQWSSCKNNRFPWTLSHNCCSVWCSKVKLDLDEVFSESLTVTFLLLTRGHASGLKLYSTMAPKLASVRSGTASQRPAPSPWVLIATEPKKKTSKVWFFITIKVRAFCNWVYLEGGSCLDRQPSCRTAACMVESPLRNRMYYPVLGLMIIYILIYVNSSNLGARSTSCRVRYWPSAQNHCLKLGYDLRPPTQ